MRSVEPVAQHALQRAHAALQVGELVLCGRPHLPFSVVASDTPTRARPAGAVEHPGGAMRFLPAAGPPSPPAAERSARSHNEAGRALLPGSPGP